jgi:hypothetical protein
MLEAKTLEVGYHGSETAWGRPLADRTLEGGALKKGGVPVELGLSPVAYGKEGGL